MTYRLLIIDDEEHIREGLGDLVDWAGLGFQVAAKLEDGQQALDWLRRTDIDIILSDIKMTRMSGLELARYVHEHYPRTKMVLISGYKEFEYVKQAMGYNVVNYLLKPTKLGDIVNVFQDVKKRLDKEREEQAQLSRALKQTGELKPAIRKQLFRDLAAGKSSDTAELEKLLRLTDIAANATDHRCALLLLSISTPETSGREASAAMPGDTLENMIRQEQDGIAYTSVSAHAGRMELVALDLRTDRPAAEFADAIRAYMQSVALRVESILGVSARAEIVGQFASLQALMQERARQMPAAHGPDASATSAGLSASAGSAAPTAGLTASAESAGITASRQEDSPIAHVPELEEARRRFLAYVAAGNLEALPDQYENIVGEFQARAIPDTYAKNMLIELISSLCGKLNAMEMPIESLTDRPFSYESILRLEDYAHMRDWGVSLLRGVTSAVQRQSSAEPAVIQSAKEYVAANYANEISLESAANHVYLSPDYFSRLFKQYTGSNFTDYVAEMRIQKALDYLRNPQFKIYEVGSIVGYKNTKYFFKLFKKHTGYTPTEYRRKSINKDLR